MQNATLKNIAVTIADTAGDLLVAASEALDSLSDKAYDLAERLEFDREVSDYDEDNDPDYCEQCNDYHGYWTDEEPEGEALEGEENVERGTE